VIWDKRKGIGIMEYWEKRRRRNIGIMECWNIGQKEKTRRMGKKKRHEEWEKRNVFLSRVFVDPILPLFQYSTIPFFLSFHYSRYFLQERSVER
jgi:hypothetical protein